MLAELFLQLALNCNIALLCGDASYGWVFQNLRFCFFYDSSRHILIVYIERSHTGNLQGQFVCKMAEALTTSYKVCAAIEFQQYAYTMIMMHIREDATLFGLTTSSGHFLGFLITPSFEVFE